jgi:hypothetical protein
MLTPRLQIILVSVLLVILPACAAVSMSESLETGNEGLSGGVARESNQDAAPAAPMFTAPMPVATPQPAQPAQGRDSARVERLIVQHANLSLEVEDLSKAEASIRARVNELGGYIVTIATSGTDENQTTRITFRVPVQRFEEALSGVEGLAKKVHSRTISGDDVTEEFVDLESQLRNLEATRDRLRTLLDQATRVQDALEVNQALTDVQGQIEQTRGRMQYLQQSAAFSTIEVYLMPVPVVPLVQEGSWQPVTVARSALRDLIELGQELINIAIVLLIWTPVWLPLLLLVRWVWRKIRGHPRAQVSESSTSTAV